MLNYMKSECYRIIKGKGYYTAIAVLTGLVLCMNIGLAVSGKYLPGFRYGTFRFSLNMFTGSIFCMVVLGAVMSGLFGDDRRCGVMRTAVAGGIAREKLFAGKCIVAFGFTFLALCVILAVYLASAYLLLPQPEWEPVREMLTGTIAILPSAAASLIFALFLEAVLQREMTAVLVWVTVYYLIPSACFLIGMKIDLFARLYRWMPLGFLRTEAVVYMNSYECLWDHAAGFSKCMIAGGIGILLFFLIGILRFRKQEL